MKKWILISAIILLSSNCATTPLVIPVRLECPPPIFLPEMNQRQVQELEFNIAADTYNILVKREKLLKARINTLCAIIESTH